MLLRQEVQDPAAEGACTPGLAPTVINLELTIMP